MRYAGLATAALGAAAVTAAAALLAAFPVVDPLLPAAGSLVRSWLVTTALAVGFLVAELRPVHVEVRRQAVSVSLAGFPLVVGILLARPGPLVLACLLGSGAAFALQRAPLAKASFNLAVFSSEVAVDVVLVHLLLGSAASLTAPVALVTWLVVLVVDGGATTAVLAVVGWHGGGVSLGERAEAHGETSLATLITSTAAYAVLLLVEQGVVGGVVVAVAAVVGVLAYQAFTTVHRRHRTLEDVQRFVSSHPGHQGTSELAVQMLGRVRELMRAARAELVVDVGDGPLVFRVADGTDVRTDTAPAGAVSALTAVGRGGDAAVVVPTGTRRASEQAWLTVHDARDAVVTRLPDGLGALAVTDRQGDTGSFTADDGHMLSMLAGHLAVAVRGSALLNRLQHDATHDALTGLANRTVLGERIAERLAASDPRSCAVLLLDLDRFKEVNDSLGHHVGDALLRVQAERIRAVVPPASTVARIGGDEFAVLVPYVADADSATAVATAVAESLATPIELPEAALRSRGSVGVVRPGPGDDAADVLRHADTAMYEAKENGRPVVVYTDELDRGRTERLLLVADLAHAVERDELVVDYQPKLDLGTGRVSGVEALVRWRHPRLGLLAPDVFVPLAESNGLIGPLTGHVLARALRQCAAWRAEGLDLTVAVNLSARTVADPALPDQVGALLADVRVPASSLVLEITESAVMDDPDTAVAVLERLAATGVTLSLDDFGTGYSSLSYLQRLPVAEVKIDRSFVIRLDSSDRSRALVRSIVNLAASLGLRVVAEGAETMATVELLRTLGASSVQGYAICRPTDPVHVAALTRSFRLAGPTRATVAAVPSPAVA